MGQGAREEVDFEAAGSGGGRNYEWSCREGKALYDGSRVCSVGLPAPPALDYGRVGGRCGASITGGYVYRGDLYPRLQGMYFYGDYCSGTIWGARQTGGLWTSQTLLQSGMAISTFGEDEDGELYVADLDGDAIYQVRDAGCTLGVRLERRAGVIEMAFEVGAKTAARWNVSLYSAFGLMPLWTRPIEGGEATETVETSLVWPALGRTGVVTTLTEEDGTVRCASVEMAGEGR